MRLAFLLFSLLLVAASADAQLITGGSGAGGGSGTVTQVQTSSPISGGPFTVSGTISCLICTTNAAGLTSGQLIKGAGGQGVQTGDLSGDVTTSGSMVTTLKNTGPGVTSCGDTTHSCSITTDIQGRVTNISNNVISASGTVSTTGSPLIHQVTFFSGAASVTGLAVGGTSGAFLRNVAASDPAWSTLILPNAGTTNDVPLTTATNTWGYDTGNFTYNVGTGTLTAPTVAAGSATSGSLTLTNVGGLGFSYIETVGNPAANLTVTPPIALPANNGTPLVSSTTGTESFTDLTRLGTITVGVWNGSNIPVSNGGTGLSQGTSGGIPAFTATGTIASSGVLTANLPVIGGGAGVAPTVGTVTGNTTVFATSTGALVNGNCAKWDSNHNLVDNGGACGSGGTGTVTTSGAPVNGNLAKFTAGTIISNADLTGDVTTSGGVATTIAANAVTSAKSAVVNTLRTCTIVVGANNGTALVDADLGPQFRQCLVPYAGTIVEVTVASDAGTPSVQIRKNHAGTTTNLLSAALAAVGGNGAATIACARTTISATCYDGTVSSGSITVSTTALAAGDFLELTSGTAGGSAKQMSIAITWSVN